MRNQIFKLRFNHHKKLTEVGGYEMYAWLINVLLWEAVRGASHPKILRGFAVERLKREGGRQDAQEDLDNTPPYGKGNIGGGGGKHYASWCYN